MIDFIRRSRREDDEKKQEGAGAEKGVVADVVVDVVVISWIAKGQNRGVRAGGRAGVIAIGRNRLLVTGSFEALLAPALALAHSGPALLE